MGTEAKGRKTRMTRRGLMVAGTAMIAGTALLAGTNAIVALGDLPSSAASLFESAAAENIGQAFASAYPNVDAVWRGRPPATKDQWGPRLRELIREDLDADQTIEIDGWWLTETEVRFCVYIHSLKA